MSYEGNETQDLSVNPEELLTSSEAAGQGDATQSSDETTEVAETVAPVVSEETQEQVTNETVTDPAPDLQFANPEPTEIHPIDLALLVSKLPENSEIAVDGQGVGQIVTMPDGTRYVRNHELALSEEGQLFYDEQIAAAKAWAAKQARQKPEVLREDLDILRAEIEELKARIDDHNARSGHKI